MGYPLLHLVLGMLLFFPILNYFVVHVIRNLSELIFNRLFRIGGFNPVDYLSDNPVGLYDVLMTYVCFVITLGISMVIVINAGEIGIIPEIPVKK